MSGHTPGPWAAVDADSDHITLISAGDHARDNGGIYVAKTQGPQNKANARLIAAAPELLAALQGFTRNRDEIAVREGAHPAFADALSRLMDMAEAAIASATGAA